MSAARNILIFSLAFLGVGATFGGGVFILASDGSLKQMPQSILVESPFPNFLAPGIILFTILGCCKILRK